MVKKSNAGRGRKLTRELIKEITEHISKGISNVDACNLCNISEGIFYRWQEHGVKHKEQGRKTIEVEFIESLKNAQAKFKSFHVQNITKHSFEDWKASAWMLERKFSKEFGRYDRNALTLDSAIKVVIGSDDKLPEDTID